MANVANALPALPSKFFLRFELSRFETSLESLYYTFDYD